MEKFWHYLADIILILIIVAWTIFLWTHGPDRVVAMIGVQNSYILLLVSSFLGGLTTLSSAFVYPTTVSLALGGIHPVLIGIFAGIGLSIANSLFYYFGLKGRFLVKRRSNRFAKYTRNLLQWINKGPRWLMPISVFTYVGLTPLPNNLLMVSGGLISCPFKRMILPLIFGNVSFLTVFHYLALEGVDILF